MNLIQATESILSQLENVIDQMTDEQFARPLITLNNSTIGQHLRHTLEFFICLEKGIESGIVNYDKREHDTVIQVNRNRAKDVIGSIVKFINSPISNSSLLLEGCYSASGEGFYSIPTSFEREMAYNLEHAVHHMAIMKIGLAEACPGMELPAHFGVAVSTIRYHQKNTVKIG